MKCFRMRGKKSQEHFDPADPPRRRANKRRGRGTYANERPPILGTVGRETGQVRLRVETNTQSQTLRDHGHQFTGVGTHVYTDEYDSYNQLERTHSTVSHSHKEWARDDDGDGMREVHTNTAEGMWAGAATLFTRCAAPRNMARNTSSQPCADRSRSIFPLNCGGKKAQIGAKTWLRPWWRAFSPPLRRVTRTLV